MPAAANMVLSGRLTRRPLLGRYLPGSECHLTQLRGTRAGLSGMFVDLLLRLSVVAYACCSMIFATSLCGSHCKYMWESHPLFAAAQP